MKIKIALVFLLLFLIIACIGIYSYVYYTQETKTLDEDTRKTIGGTYVKLSKGIVSYRLIGPYTGQTVILIHGAGSGMYAWDNNYDYLAKKGFRVLMYDMYGRGFSDRPELSYDSALFNHQLKEIIDTFHLKAPYNLVAVSMGASIALHYVQNNKSIVSHLVLVDPASLSDGKIAWHLKTPILSSLLMSLYWYPRAVEKQMKEYFDPSSVPEYRIKSVENLQYKGLKRAMLSTWQNVLPLDMTKAMQEIGKTNIKVLLVWGKNDPLIPPNTSTHYLNAMPQSRLIEIDSAGHLSNYEKPAIFNNAIFKFLRDE